MASLCKRLALLCVVGASLAFAAGPADVAAQSCSMTTPECPPPAFPPCPAGMNCVPPGPGGCNGQCQVAGAAAGDAAGDPPGGNNGGPGGAAGGGVGSCAPQPLAPADPQRPMLRRNNALRLMQPLDAINAPPDAANPGAVPAGAGTLFLGTPPGIGIFFCYFNLSWPWILGVGAGIAILQAIVGGMQIMLSGGAEQKSAGESRLTWALAGLVLIALAGFLLRVLNPIFYT